MQTDSKAKFIHIFDTNLKDNLIKLGYVLLCDSNGIFIFENNTKLSFNFSEADKQKYAYSNRLII